MSNPSKKKGTSGETELLRLFNAFGFHVVRTAPTLPYDLVQHPTVPARYEDVPIEVLATRPDRGRWLVSLDLDNFFRLLGSYEELSSSPLHIEVKRYRRFAHHAIYEEKFGRSK